jgi:hypothetical protein
LFFVVPEYFLFPSIIGGRGSAPPSPPPPRSHIGFAVSAKP